MSNDGITEIMTKFNVDLSVILKAIANERRILLLSRLNVDKATFKELMGVIKQSKTALAHHLDQLLQSKLIKQLDRGIYSITQDGLDIFHAIGEGYFKLHQRRNDEMAKLEDIMIQSHSKKIRKKEEFSPKIVELEPMRIASFRIISKTPEHDTWMKLKEWAVPRGLLSDNERHPIFGFNNPNPKPGKEEYGYEFWIKIDSDFEDYGGAEIKDFKGGLYAVASCKLLQDIGAGGFLNTWDQLDEWVKQSEYDFGDEQCLEKAQNPGAPEDDLVLELYLAIRIPENA
ncbi:MAG: GyrI-like domain-containing protein [Candidatus Kariarchaeaceae archaeon]|jgi:DNA gyrase inhibitor GyrI/DNA-binding HxlR family transcriptional regulator